MSSSYSENDLACQESLLWFMSIQCCEIYPQFVVQKTKIYSSCLQIRGPSGNRGELENIPETLNIKELNHRGTELVWVEVLQNHKLIMTESNPHTLGTAWGTFGGKWKGGVLTLLSSPSELLGILEIMEKFQQISGINRLKTVFLSKYD